jgi:hypothetical protein
MGRFKYGDRVQHRQKEYNETKIVTGTFITYLDSVLCYIVPDTNSYLYGIPRKTTNLASDPRRAYLFISSTVSYLDPEKTNKELVLEKIKVLETNFKTKLKEKQNAKTPTK